jgi:hypothetical protein
LRKSSLLEQLGRSLVYADRSTLENARRYDTSPATRSTWTSRL